MSNTPGKICIHSMNLITRIRKISMTELVASVKIRTLITKSKAFVAVAWFERKI